MTGAFSWRAVPPEEVGLSTDALEALRDNLAARGTNTLLVLRHDRIALEWYSPEWSAARPHFTASLAKALVGGTSLILALQDGLLDVDQPVATLVPQWRDDPLKSRITIRHLATHTSGLQDAGQEGIAHEALPGWMGRFWKRDDPDPFTISRDETSVVVEPGSAYHYSNPGMAMLSYAITAALRGTAQPDVRILVRERVFAPIGLSEEEWSIGYGQTYEVDGLPLVANWGGGGFTARAVASVARLMLRGGDWDGHRLLDAGRVKQALTYAGMPIPDRSHGPAPASGLCWYTNEDGAWPDISRDAFAGAGAQHQLLLVVPSLDLIVVRNGRPLEPGNFRSSWAATYQHVFAPTVNAVVA